LGRNRGAPFSRAPAATILRGAPASVFGFVRYLSAIGRRPIGYSSSTFLRLVGALSGIRPVPFCDWSAPYRVFVQYLSAIGRRPIGYSSSTFLRLVGAFRRSRAVLSRGVAVLSRAVSVQSRAGVALASGRAVSYLARVASFLGWSRVVGARARVAVGVGGRWSAGRRARRRRGRSCALARRARWRARCRRSRSLPSRLRAVGHRRPAVVLRGRARSASVGCRPFARSARAAGWRRSLALLSSARARRSSSAVALSSAVGVVSARARWCWVRAPSFCAGVVVVHWPRALSSSGGMGSALGMAARVGAARAGARGALRARNSAAVSWPLRCRGRVGRLVR
jgi:hypothetical protein